MKIAIVGVGFVGKALDYGFTCEKYLVDPKLDTKIEDLLDYNPDAVFISVPTPMNSDGSVNASIVIECVEYCLKKLPYTYIIIKSTVTPDIIKDLASKSEHVIYNPEFLTEANYKSDFIHPEFHIFGVSNVMAFEFIDQLYYDHSICSKIVPIRVMSPEEASFIKYGLNCFLASKVLWMNQFYDVISKTESRFEVIKDAMKLDRRIGTSHMNIPGPDGRFGFGGACFKKDVAAFIEYSKFPLLDLVNDENNKIRSQYDLSQRELDQNVTYNDIV